MRLEQDTEHYHRTGPVWAPGLRTKLRVSPVLHSVQRTAAKTKLLYPVHTHPAIEIIIPERKIYSCILNGEKISVPKGKMLFVQIGDTHQDIYERGMRYFAITFTLDVSGEPGGPNRVFRRGINPEEQMTDVPAIQASKAISRLVESEDSCESAFAHHAANGLFTAFFWETIQRLDTGLLSPLLMESAIQESFKQALLRCFEKNLTGKITLAELARTLGMSESSLSHKTREILGVPPLRALTNHKMQKARQMLLETNLSIKEISENLGFENQFHFSRTFKSCFGQSPAKHR